MMTTGKAMAGIRKNVVGEWYKITIDSLGTRKSFNVFSESLTECIAFLIYDSTQKDDVFTHCIKINGTWIEKEDVEKALETLHDSRGISKNMYKLFAISNTFSHLY